jgi:hypothetical protein
MELCVPVVVIIAQFEGKCAGLNMQFQFNEYIRPQFALYI